MSDLELAVQLTEHAEKYQDSCHSGEFTHRECRDRQKLAQHYYKTALKLLLAYQHW
jgi:hypothetical protein